MKLVSAGLALTVVAAVAPATAATVYSNNFDTAVVTAPGVTSVFSAAGGGTTGTVAPYTAYGNVFRNSSTGLTSLTISNLPAHTSLSLSYLLGFLDSWDSTNGSPAPDWLDFYIDGNLTASYTYNNASGSSIAVGGGSVLAQYVQFDANSFFSDTIVDMSSDASLTFAHTASSITFAWQASGDGWQGSSDEAWGIDNIVVGVTGRSTNVPEPASLALLALAGIAAGAARRRAR